MELVLTQIKDYQVNVTCDHHPSHTFDLQPLRLLGHWFERITDDPIKYGQLLFQALFPPNSLARHMLDAHPERMVLVNTDEELDTLPWEYLYGPEGFLVLDIPFVRGLPAEQRLPAPTLDMPLHIVAVPSNPLSNLVEPLNIDAEWSHLTEMIKPLPFNVTLERVRPPTLQQVHNLLANTHQRVLHFMGHGEQVKDGTYLYFEKDNGDLDLVETEQLIAKIHGTPFLITLNACVSASPGPTEFSNLAASLVKAKVPYTLGMRFRIYDDDALVFSRTFYTELAQGAPIEEALLQTRRSLAKRPRTWTVGVPVLYTSLATPTGGFVQHTGTFHIDEHQPRIEASGVARAIGTFQGRTDDLKRLGNLLTGDHRPRILTIHGGGGQGKTALAREAIERFAYAWPGGIWGIMLDPLPDRSGFVSQLAQFLGINVQETINPKDLEHQVLRILTSRRILLVLDNAETLVDAIEANNPQATSLAEFIQQLPSTSISLLVTSRIQLGWPGEITHELGGLTSEEGALLFRQYAPDRLALITMDEAQQLSKKIEGHPLGLRLLAGAFNASSVSLNTFIHQYEEHLVHAENTYVSEEHRHRKLYASIETSIRYLNDDLRHLLSNLWIFQAPFIPDIARYIFDPNTKERSSPVSGQLNTLWRRGLLARITITTRDGTQDLYQDLYHLLPTTRPYVQTYLYSTIFKDELFHRYGKAYNALTNEIYNKIEKNAIFALMAQNMEKDLENGVYYVEVHKQQFYKTHWAFILSRLGKPRQAQAILEEVLEQAQGQNQALESFVLYHLGRIYHAIGQPRHALELYKRSLSIRREVNDRSEEVTTIHNMAAVYHDIGQPHHALSLYEQALSIRREVNDRSGEAATLDNMASIYHDIGQPHHALSLYEQALPIRREVNDRSGEAATLNNMATVYQNIGQPHHALSLYEQALSIRREVNDRSGEAATLNNMAAIYRNIGQPHRALELFELALSIRREINGRSGEAATLNNIAAVYHDIGQPHRALELLELALPIRREVNDRSGEAATLSNMANAYRVIGQPQRALELYKLVLPIRREVNDRAGEAATLSDMTNVYHAIGQSQRALELLELALLIRREVNDRSGEANTLNNMAVVYHDIGQPHRALELLELALSVSREVSNRSIEATILSNMANAYRAIGQPQRALLLYEQALSISHEVGNRPSKTAATLSDIAILLYEDLECQTEALHYVQQAHRILEQYGLPQDSAGRTLEEIYRFQEMIQRRLLLGQVNTQQSTLPSDVQKQMIINTIAVMTKSPERHKEWRRRVETFLREAQAKGPTCQAEVDFYTSLLAILDGKKPSLPSDHSYASAIASIQNSIVQKQPPDQEKKEETFSLTSNSEMLATIMNDTLAVLSQAKSQRLAWQEELFAIRQTFSQQKGTHDFITLLDAILALLDRNGDPTGLGKTLSKEYDPIWQALLYHLETMRQEHN